MNETVAETNKDAAASSGGISLRRAEVVVALFFLAIAGMVLWDSVRLGFRWGEDGPEAGYFPFYIGLFIGLSSLYTLYQALTAAATGALFVERHLLKQVLAVLLPAAVYVLGIQFVGIYLASAIYIAGFMMWLGHYPAIKSVIISVVVSAAMFMMFEIWFQVPLFKGEFNPLSVLGY